MPPVPRIRPGAKLRVALGVGRRLAEHLVVDRDEAEMHVADRPGACRASAP